VLYGTVEAKWCESSCRNGYVRLGGIWRWERQRTSLVRARSPGGACTSSRELDSREVFSPAGSARPCGSCGLPRGGQAQVRGSGGCNTAGAGRPGGQRSVRWPRTRGPTYRGRHRGLYGRRRWLIGASPGGTSSTPPARDGRGHEGRPMSVTRFVQRACGRPRPQRRARPAEFLCRARGLGGADGHRRVLGVLPARRDVLVPRPLPGEQGPAISPWYLWLLDSSLGFFRIECPPCSSSCRLRCGSAAGAALLMGDRTSYLNAGQTFKRSPSSRRPALRPGATAHVGLAASPDPPVPDPRASRA